jgi:protein required for attachment to host cells
MQGMEIGFEDAEWRPNKETGMLIPHGAVIALVDGTKFEIYRNSGNEAEPALEAMDVPKFDEHNKGAGAHHYSSSENPARHLLDEDAHAAAVADWLNGEVIGHRIEHLIVIAAPRTLGELRRHYHKQVEAALVMELHKDLNGRPPADILSALRDSK